MDQHVIVHSIVDKKCAFKVQNMYYSIIEYNGIIMYSTKQYNTNKL